MAAVTIHSDFGDPKNKLSLFPLFPHLFDMKLYDLMPSSSFFECRVLSQLFPLSSFTLIKRLFNFSLLSAMRVISSVYLRLLIFLLAILTPVVFHSGQHIQKQRHYFANKGLSSQDCGFSSSRVWV